MNLEETLKCIGPLNEEAMKVSRKRWDSIAKPLYSLGKLESLLVQIAGITGSQEIDLSKKALVPICAVNGVVAEGVTQTGQEVTAIVAENFLTCETSAAIMCKSAGADIFPVDIGVAVDTNIINRKIAYGTKNMAVEPAMTREEAIRGLEIGIAMVKELKDKGYTIIATGEMGIGNTTTSSAVAAVLLGQPAEAVTGKGAGLTSAGLDKKIATIKKAIALHKPDREDPIDVLAKVGGFDIAGIAGMFLGGAAYHIPVVIDGFISAVSALLACRLAPLAKGYMISSHVSKEPAAHMILEALDQSPCLHCDMCLGEGTGAVALFPVLEMAAAVYQGMSTFSDIEIEEYKPLS